MATDRVQCCVIGAGVIGLAIARALAQSGLEVIILERGSQIGTGISSRNSEVMHAGIYYEKNSLKSKLCVEGKKLLYDYCESNDVDYKRIGKLIVATNDQQISKLNSIADKALQNGVDDLIYLNEKEIHKLEPEVNAKGALFSPSTGIIDSYGLMQSLLKDAEDAGAMLALNTKVMEGCFYKDDDSWCIGTQNTEVEALNIKELDIGLIYDGYHFNCDMVINCSGLSSTETAFNLGCENHTCTPKTTYAKGNYFSLTNIKSPFNHLVYPLPSKHGLGVHATLDLNNQVRFGPDVEWVENDDEFTVDINRSESFYESIRQYWPNLPDDSLVPAYAGIRPKILPYEDFMIQNLMRQQSSNKSVECMNLINLFGIESPGLTSSLAIAETVKEMVLTHQLIVK